MEKNGVVELVKKAGWLCVFDDCGWQWESVAEFIRDNYGGKSNPSRIISEARSLFIQEGGKCPGRKRNA